MNTLILVLSLVAGVVGTGLGGVIGVLLKNRGNKIMGRVLSFAGGVMVGVVTFEMLPEAVSYSTIENSIAQSGILIAVSALVVGMLVVYGLNKLLDVIENMRETHRSIEELHHETWVNLQLPLYRHFLRKISPSSEKEEVKLGYIVLNKSAKTKAYLAPWTADDLRFADVVCRWVVDSILELCQRGEINPRAFLVEGMRECGRLLEPERLVYDDFAPITLSYLEEL